MYDLGYADISNPFSDDGDIRGITIYNMPTLKMVDSLAKSDPMVKAEEVIVDDISFLKWYVLSFEDPITSKLKANRLKDLLDIQGLNKIQ